MPFFNLEKNNDPMVGKEYITSEFGVANQIHITSVVRLSRLRRWHQVVIFVDWQVQFQVTHSRSRLDAG